MFISKHKDAFGVARACRVLSRERLADRPGHLLSGGAAATADQAMQDAQVLAEIVQMRADYEEVYGARKTWLELNRRGIAVARCTVERVMRENGLRARAAAAWSAPRSRGGDPATSRRRTC